jgi:hypothetical protein
MTTILLILLSVPLLWLIGLILYLLFWIDWDGEHAYIDK